MNISESENNIDATLRVLDSIIAGKKAGEQREGQSDMAAWIATAVDTKRHFICQAGTGIGKTYAYLAAIFGTNSRAIITTATKTLQDQLADDLLTISRVPDIAKQIGTWQVVKGRGAYVCPAKIFDLYADDSLNFEPETSLEEIIFWWKQGGDGERDHGPAQVSDEEWATISISGIECPGKRRCVWADQCPAMQAIDNAKQADVVIVNHHLYGAHLKSDGNLFGSTDVAIVDEAHRLEDSLTSAFGYNINAKRLGAYIAGTVSLLKAGGVSSKLVKRFSDPLWDDKKRLEKWIENQPEGALKLPLREDALTGISTISGRVSRSVDDVKELLQSNGATGTQIESGRQRLANLAGHIAGDLLGIVDSENQIVAWKQQEGRIEVAPINISGDIQRLALKTTPTIFTSATLTVGGEFERVAHRLGFTGELTEEEFLVPQHVSNSKTTELSEAEEAVLEVLDGITIARSTENDDEADLDTRYYAMAIESPFNYGVVGRIWVPQIVEPSNPQWGEEVAVVSEKLVDAAGGRALILSTSSAGVKRIAEKLRAGHIAEEHVILVQGEHAKSFLTQTFAEDETSILIATMGYWEGLDIPGRACQLVIIDRIPFPRPNDPLWEARRKWAREHGENPFNTVDMERAATGLAQGCGRLIRTQNDEGLVAICDRRIFTKSYGRTLLASIPEFEGLETEEQALAFLEEINY